MDVECGGLWWQAFVCQGWEAGAGMGGGCSSEAGHSHPYPSSSPVRTPISLLVSHILVVTLYLVPGSVGQHRAKVLPL